MRWTDVEEIILAATIVAIVFFLILIAERGLP